MFGVLQVTGQHLPLQFKADQEKEQGHQAAIDPFPERQREVQLFENDTGFQITDGCYDTRPRGIRAAHRQHRRQRKQQGGRGLFVNENLERRE